MEFKEFLMQIDNYDFGVVAFNTYSRYNIKYCCIMVALNDQSGEFYKREGKTRDLDVILSDIYALVVKHWNL